MTDSRTAIDAFWDWWQRHRADFDALRHASDPFWDVALDRLQQIHGSLRFEISEPNASDREFIVTAEGNIDVFPLAVQTVECAPQISGWQFIALKPPMGFDFKTTYEGMLFDPRQMWFLPLLSDASPTELGLRIAVPALGIATKRQAYNAVAVILDTALGERSGALDIQFIEVCPSPDKPEAEGYIKLPMLPQYLEWRNRRAENA